MSSQAINMSIKVQAKSSQVGTSEVKLRTCEVEVGTCQVRCVRNVSTQGWNMCQDGKMYSQAEIISSC